MKGSMHPTKEQCMGPGPQHVIDIMQNGGKSQLSMSQNSSGRLQ